MSKYAPTSPPGDRISLTLGLPAPDERPLARSPLAQVVCQLRFGATVPVTAGVAAEFTTFMRDRGFDYPKADPMQTLTVNVNPLRGAESVAGPSGWRLQSDDGWVVGFSDDSLSLETTRYANWHDDFRKRLEAALGALNELIGPEAETRLGIRFIDIITTPVVHSLTEWRGRIADWLLGPLLHERIGPALTNMQQQLALDLGDNAKATIRHGTFPDAARESAYTYLLDCDIYRDRLLPFDVQEVHRAADAFHVSALSLFQAMVTPEFLASLREPA
jgi:uncharacterized protein (TIGR04255 family)